MPDARWQPDVRDRRYRQLRDDHPRIVTEGDSWFDYPLHLNLIDHLDDRGEFALLRFEKSGDTVENITRGRNLKSLRRVMRRERPVAFLFSGGGNDLFIDLKVPKLRWIYRALNDYEPGFGVDECINTAEWDRKRLGIESGYVSVIEAIGEYAPVVAHGYDYLIPTGRKAEYDGFRIGGPWIRTALDARGIPTSVDPAADLQRKVIARFIDDFDAMLVRLEQRYRGTFHRVSFLGALDPARDWHNEIHPTEAGFAKVELILYNALKARVLSGALVAGGGGA